MRSRARRFATIMSAVVALSLIAVPGGVSAQGDDVAESLCGLFSRKEVRTALGTKTHKARPERDLFYCGWNITGSGDSTIPFNIHWSDFTLDGMRLLLQDTSPGPATDHTVGGKRALYHGGSGAGRLLLELSQGVLDMSIYDTDTDWQPVLLQLGELAVARAADLVPMGPPPDAAFLALLPTTAGDVTFAIKTDRVGRIYTDRERRRALRDALEAIGKTTADVSMIGGVDPAGSASISAFRVAGADATALVGAALASIEGPGVATVPEALANGQAGYIPRMEGDGATYVRLIYPKDDIVWAVRADEALAAQIMAALPGAPVAPVVPAPTPAPTPDISTPEGYLTSLLPATVAGEPLTVQVFPAGGALTTEGAKVFKAVLKEQSKTIDDLVFVGAFSTSGTQIQGFRITGGDAIPLEAAVVKFLKETGQVGKNADPEPADVAGKSTRRLKTTIGDAHLYPKDDVLWIVIAANEADLTEVFTGLP